MTKPLRLALSFIAILALTACFQDSKADILGKAQGVGTTDALKAALGGPDEINKLGPLAQWIYEASDGTVVFSIIGDKVTLEHTGAAAKK
jgi:hypothetical protein